MESDPIGLGGGINTYLYAMARPTALVDPFGLLSARVRECVCTYMWIAQFQAYAAWDGALTARKSGQWDDPVLRPCENYLYAYAAVVDYGDSPLKVRAGVYLQDWSKVLPRQTSPRSAEAKNAGLEGVSDGEKRKDWRKDCDTCKKGF